VLNVSLMVLISFSSYHLSLIYAYGSIVSLGRTASLSKLNRPRPAVCRHKKHKNEHNICDVVYSSGIIPTFKL